MFDKIKQWYEWGLWTVDMVRNAVPSLITAEQFTEITGQKY